MSKISKPYNIEPYSLVETANGISQMPFGKLIGNILSACVDAQSNASQVAWMYTQEVLKRSETPMVFTYQDAETTRRIEVPLITIVPLPYMRLDNIDIDFDASVNVNDLSHEEFVVKTKSLEVTGSNTTTLKSEANMHININAGTSDMPAGLSSLLKFINDGIIVEKHPGNLPSRPGSSYPGSRPGSSRPGSSYPGSRPGSSQPGSSRPGSSRPGSSRPGSSQPGSSRPGSSRPGSSQPGSSRPGSSRPGSSQPGSSRPGSSRPGSSSPVSSGSRLGSSSLGSSYPRSSTSTGQAKGNAKPLDGTVHGIISNIADNTGNVIGKSKKKTIDRRRLKATKDMKPIEPTFYDGDGLLALHVLWTRPTLMGNPDWKYGTDDFEILSTVLSALLWRRFNGPIKLYTDTKGLEFYNDLGMTDLWNGGIDSKTLTKIPETIPADIFWAAGKIYAIKKEEVPFVMMDTDLLVWDSIEPYIKGNSLMAYHPEDLYYDIYPPFEQLKKPEKYSPDKKWDWTLNPYNTALTYFANDEASANFKKDYVQKAIKFMNNNTERPDDMTAQMVFAEQRLFAMVAQLHVGYPVPTFLDYMDQQDRPFTHLWGTKYEARSNEEAQHNMSAAIGQSIRQIFPDAHLSEPIENILNKYC